MCGIIGYTGVLDAKKVIIEGLKELEYRGYDSAGMALVRDEKDHAGELYIMKEAGPVSVLEESTRNDEIKSGCGIGHTRWATHGGVTDCNAHPHTTGRVTLIHNGIIENYRELVNRYGLQDQLISETDSEVALRVIDYYYGETKDPFEAIKKAVSVIEGSYSFCIMFAKIPGKIFCIRNVSPLVAAHMDKGSIIASDLTALVKYTRDYFILPENTIAVLSPEGIRLYELNGNETAPEMLHADWDIESVKKGGYPHFMLKEINEQPDALNNTVKPRLSEGLPDFSEDGIPDSLFTEMKEVCIVACGTANYAGMVGKSIMEPILRIPVSVNIASEFRYDDPLVDDKTLTIIISQSGETIDTLEAMKLAMKKGSKTLAIVNVKGSTIAREADHVLYTHAGPEISVASTKAYTVQLAALYMIACRMAYARKIFDRAAAEAFMKEVTGVVPAIEEVLSNVVGMKHVSEKMLKAKDAFYIGRGLDYAFSLEGSLKLKEISYIHAEAYPAGELKHGTIALIEKDTPVVAIATQENIYAKTISNVREVKARGAYVTLITKKGKEVGSDICDIHLEIPEIDDRFTVFPVAVMLQLIAYYTADGKGLDVDKPRNLAKSVTVE